MNDPYWDLIGVHWPNIHRMYTMFAGKNPVMLLDVQDQWVYAYPFRQFTSDLSARTRKSFADQYRKAVAEREAVVFVRDNEKRKLVSYSVKLA